VRLLLNTFTTFTWERILKPKALTKNIEAFKSAVSSSTSIADVWKRLGVDNPFQGSYYRMFHAMVEKHDIDTSHFTGQVWNKGKTLDYKPPTTLSLDEVLLGLHPTYPTSSLKRRLLKEGYFDMKCSVCGITEWLGQPAPLQLDHINGVSHDHRRENLRLLCPNCHALTPTFAGKNRKKNSDC